MHTNKWCERDKNLTSSSSSSSIYCSTDCSTCPSTNFTRLASNYKAIAGRGICAYNLATSKGLVNKVTNSCYVDRRKMDDMSQ